MNYIDIGIDFGAENIVIVAIGYDNKGRKDYKLVTFENNFSIKNYIGEKNNNELDIGSNPKLSYAHSNLDKSYKWVEGRYKSYLSVNSNKEILEKAKNLIEKGLKLVLEKIEKFDFSPFFQGVLRNLVVGIPQDWDINKKNLYLNTLSIWKYGEVNLLSEPVAATITAINKSIKDLSDKNIMILDIGASTLDISFSKYTKEHNINIYNTTKRIDTAGHYFDIILTSFALFSDINKQAKYHILPRMDILKLRKIDDYINYISINQSQYSSLLLEIESIKENNLAEIIKFNKKKLIDTNALNPLVINKLIYEEALNYYVLRISKEINNTIGDFTKKYNLSENKELSINPLLCGGISSLFGFEKKLKENISYGENIISVLDSSYNKIDITIALGLAYFAQDKTIISKKLDCIISCDFFIDDEKKEIILFNNENYPLKNSKKLSSLINDEQVIEFHGESNEISFYLNIKKDDKEKKEIITAKFESIEKGDNFDILFNIDINEVINIELVNNNKRNSVYVSLPINGSIV